MNYKSTFITSHPSAYLSIKGAEQLRVPSSGLVNLAIDMLKMVRSIVEDFGDDEGAFPCWGEFVWFLLIHSKNQVFFLKGPTPHIPGVESTQILLINGRADQGHLFL